MVQPSIALVTFFTLSHDAEAHTLKSMERESLRNEGRGGDFTGGRSWGRGVTAEADRAKVKGRRAGGVSAEVDRCSEEALRLCSSS